MSDLTDELFGYANPQPQPVYLIKPYTSLDVYVAWLVGFGILCTGTRSELAEQGAPEETLAHVDRHRWSTPRVADELTDENLLEIGRVAADYAALHNPGEQEGNTAGE